MLLQQDFDHIVARTPDKAALVCGDTRHSYANLAAGANSLAALLHARGVRPGDRVALFFDNGVEFVAGMLAARCSCRSIR